MATLSSCSFYALPSFAQFCRLLLTMRKATKGGQIGLKRSNFLVRSEAVRCLCKAFADHGPSSHKSASKVTLDGGVMTAMDLPDRRAAARQD